MIGRGSSRNILSNLRREGEERARGGKEGEVFLDMSIIDSICSRKKLLS